MDEKLTPWSCFQKLERQLGLRGKWDENAVVSHRIMAQQSPQVRESPGRCMVQANMAEMTSPNKCDGAV